MGMGGGNLVGLAKAKDVAADLKLSEEQTKKLDDLDKKMSDKRREAFSGGGGDREAMAEKMRELNEETNKELTAVLNADQMKRLKQLQLQSTLKGPGGLVGALMNADTQKALSLNDEQKEQLRGFQQDAGTQMREIFQNTQDQDERQKKMTEFRDSMAKKVEKLLTDEQKAKLKDLQGEPFKGEFPRPPAGRPRKDRV
jgi:hypothetical protein